MRATTTLGPIFILALSTGIAFGQARGISGNGFDSGGINIIPKTDPKKVTKKVKTIQYVAVSPERVWKSSDKKQKPITGSLLAFERETKTGKVSIVKDDKVRLLVGKKDFTIPLTRLSPDDQIYIQNLEDSARIAGKLIEPPKAAKKEPTDKKSGAEEKKAGPSSAGDK